MPETPRAARFDYYAMTDAELRITRDTLGVTGDWLAKRLKVDPRTYRRWELGQFPIPPGVADEVEGLLAEAEKIAAAEAGRLVHVDLPTLYTYRSDDDYRQGEPDGRHCAGWHRAIAGRIKAAVPQLVIAYYSALPDLDPDHAEQLMDVMNGVAIDAAARQAPLEFLISEIEDCLDDTTGKTAYPGLLAAARTWTSSEAAALLTRIDARRAHAKVQS
jgi:hypothetical protein